jgi:hypothetical protein
VESELGSRVTARLHLPQSFHQSFPTISPTINLNSEVTTMSPNAGPGSATASTPTLIKQQAQEASNQQDQIMVPTELFNALLEKVNQLDDTVSKLQDENTSMQQESHLVKDDLSTLHQSCGGAFRLFPKLPLELRR